ncbi:hypothetical protein JTE90_015571 [Oedothorax gibbosus]|uniref:Uncharacterized protein n=1 Tax=Oedothorax gibbosus TaxID=931172 RepID=A0AAV6TH09_9ARAC|nr:hypothetical protein JTE90_015571 [Oedothorax gibbosus]
MILSFRNSCGRYKDAKKEQEVLDTARRNEKKRKLEKEKKVRELQAKKIKILENAQREVDSIESEVQSLKNKPCWEDKEGRKNMSKNSFKSLTTLRQRFRLNPEDENEEKEEAGEQDESSDDDDDKPMDFLEKDPKPEKEDTKSKLLKGSDDDDSEDEDIEWGSFSEDEDIEWGSFFKFIFF